MKRDKSLLLHLHIVQEIVFSWKRSCAEVYQRKQIRRRIQHHGSSLDPTLASFRRNSGARMSHRTTGPALEHAPKTARSKAKSTVALMLTFAAGMVDIVGYIAVYHWFVAHMTGDTVHFGNQLATEKWTEVAKAGTVIASFVLGSILGRAVIEAGARKQQRSIASITLLAEAALIFAFMCVRSLMASNAIPLATVLVLLALLAGAMGLQTATLTKIGPLTIHTTFVTGMLNKFAEAMSEWFFALYDQKKKGLGWRASSQHSAFRNARFMAMIWFSYMFGSIAGTWMYSRWSVWVLYLPIAILIASALIDQLCPLTLEEEKEQTQA